MSGIELTINETELWMLINGHLDAERTHANKGQYADASDEKARAAYLKTLLPKSEK